MIEPPAPHLLKRRMEWLWDSDFAALFALFLLTIAAYWKIALTNQFTWMDGADTAFQVAPWFQEEVRQWRTGHFPIWEAHHWAGQSLIGRMEPGVAYPLNWLLALFPLEAGHIRFTVLNWYFVLIHFMAAAFCYAFCRDLKTSRVAAVLASSSFAFGGYMGNIAWPQMLSGALWMPLIFLYLLRALRGTSRRWFHAAACGVCMGMSLLSGHHQAPLFIALAVATTLIFWGSCHASWSRSISIGLTAAVFGGLMAAVQLLPSREYYQLALRWVGAKDPVTFGQQVPYTAHMALSFHPISLFGVLIPGVEANISPLLGFTVFCLALIAVLWAWDHLEVRLFSLIAVFGILLCIGQYSLLEGLLYAIVPGMDKARNISFAIFIFQFPVAILAAIGLDHAFTKTIPVQALKRIGLSVMAIGALLYIFLVAHFAFEPHVEQYQIGVPLGALNAVLFASLFLLWINGRIPNRNIGFWFIALSIFETGAARQALYPHHETGWNQLDGLTHHADVARFLRDHLEDGRFDVNAADLPNNLGDWDDLDQYDGYTGITVNIVRMAFSPNARRLYGVRYYVAKKPRTEGEEPVFQGAYGLNIFREPEAFPRAWSVSRLNPITDEAVPGKIALAKPEDLRNSAFVTTNLPPLDTCDGDDQVTYRKVRPTSYIVSADMRCRHMVVIGNNYFPGWKVVIDGRESKMYEVDGSLQGFIVPGGKHKVEVTYKPASVYIGASLSASALIGLLALGFLSKPYRDGTASTS